LVVEKKTFNSGIALLCIAGLLVILNLLDKIPYDLDTLVLIIAAVLGFLGLWML